MTEETTTRIHIIHTDAGHGWVEVPMAEVNKLGIASQISTCSYQSKDGKTAYLEEDCDMSLYLKALGYDCLHNRPKFEDKYTESSFIRDLHFYNRGAR